MSEPFETLTIDIEETHQGGIMEKLGQRKAELKDMMPDGKGRVRLDYMIPTRGLIGFHTEFLMATGGTGLMYHVFDHYAPQISGAISQRSRGVLIANAPGKATAYSLFSLQDRGQLFIGHKQKSMKG